MSDPNLLAGVKDQARQAARQQLGRSAMFRTMSVDEQQDLYHAVVKENYDKLLRQQGLSTGMNQKKGPGAEMGFGDYDPGFDASVDAFEDLVDSVDFPKFVADLLKAVFTANMDVMKSQTDDFIRLMREATKSTADFLKKVNDEDAFAYLVESPGSQFNLTMEEDPEGGSKLSLATPEGEPVDMDDNEVKAKIMDAKIALAKEHRAALREILLMGVTRLVVEKGEIEAGVEFKITAKRDSRKTHKDQNINTTSLNASYGGGLMGSIFGGPSGSFNMTNTNIQINTASKTAQDEMTAKLIGKVNIRFKTDYFKLDNFANMYADGGVAALPQGPAAPAPGGLPPTGR